MEIANIVVVARDTIDVVAWSSVSLALTTCSLAFTVECAAIAMANSVPLVTLRLHLISEFYSLIFVQLTEVGFS